MLSVKDVDEKRKMTRRKLQLLKSERETELLVFVNGCWPALTRDCSHSCFACRDFGLISRGLFPQVISARHHLTPGASTGGFPGLLPTANLQEWTFVYGSLCLSQGWPCLTFSHPCSIVLINSFRHLFLPSSHSLIYKNAWKTLGQWVCCLFYLTMLLVVRIHAVRQILASIFWLGKI